MQDTTKKALFFSSVIPIEHTKHATYGLQPSDTQFSFARDFNALPVVAAELAVAAQDYPIIFIGDEFIPSIALSIKENNNAFVDDNGAWRDTTHIPMCVRRYPLISVVPQDAETPVLCMDENSTLITDDNPSIPFFVDGKASKAIQEIFNLSVVFEQSLKTTRAAVLALADLGVFAAKTFTYKDQSGKTEKLQFTGIDDKKVDELSDEDFIKLRKNAALDLVFAHRLSMNNWSKLV